MGKVALEGERLMRQAEAAAKETEATRSRIRRKIMHRTTRSVGPTLRTEWEMYYKDLVQKAVTEVLNEELR